VHLNFKDDSLCHMVTTDFQPSNLTTNTRFYSTRAFLIAFACTLNRLFDLPVFWPILLMYFIILFFLTMRRQIAHMVKYKYVPWNLSKKVLRVDAEILGNAKTNELALQMNKLLTVIMLSPLLTSTIRDNIMRVSLINS
jgi:Rer1 family